MSKDKYWSELLISENLKRGWHLSRVDIVQDFAEDLYSADVFANDLDLCIQEISNRLATDSYSPHPLFQIEVPKSSLSVRPGAVMAISDRVILSTVVVLLAPEIDKMFPDSVYSWRLKYPLPKKGNIFKETSILDMPYLKKATIKSKLDPFEPWYNAWPEFDQISRKTFGPDNFRFLATSDIAAYFENIQLPILRDHLLNYFPTEPRIINLLMTFLETWARKTEDGRPHLRGIPQGNAISSFLGNLFLLPLDKEFAKFEKDHDARYQRYMDDVRVFSKDYSVARRAVFLMDHTLRRLHLNVQTAKTKILDEYEEEISSALVDSRIDKVNEIINQIPDDPSRLDAQRKETFLKLLDSIARENPPRGRQKIVHTRRPLSGLDIRLFSRWIHAHNLLDSHKYVRRLVDEIKINPDYRLIRKLIQTVHRHPSKHTIETQIMDFLTSEENIFAHQEAECLRALRYLSQLSQKTIDYCLLKVRDHNAHAYVRMQAAYLLSRTELVPNQISGLLRIFDLEKDSSVKASLACLLIQRRANSQEIIQKITLHPNEKVSSIGKLFRKVRNDEHAAKERLAHIFREGCSWIVCDNMPFLHLMHQSPNLTVRTLLQNAIRPARRKCRIRGLKPILDNLYSRIKASIADKIEGNPE